MFIVYYKNIKLINLIIANSPISSLQLEVVLNLRDPEGGLAPAGVVRVLREPLVRHGAVGHQHHGLQSAGLAGPRDGEIVPHEARVDLSMIHGGVHVGRLLHHHLQLLCSQSEGQESCGAIVTVNTDLEVRTVTRPG